MEREAGRGSADGGRGVASLLGGGLSPAAYVLSARVETRRGRRRKAVLGPLPARAAAMESRRRLGPARESLRRHAAVSGSPRPARDGEQLGYQAGAEQG